MAFSKSIKIYCEVPIIKECTVEHIDSNSSIMSDLLQMES